MGASRADKQIYFEKLKELLAKYRPYCPIWICTLVLTVSTHNSLHLLGER